MKEEQIADSQLSPELLRDLEMIDKIEQTDRSVTVRKLLSRAAKDWKMEYFAKLYAEGRVSVARAARECGVSIWEMMDYLRQKKIPSQYDFEEWEKDLATVEKTGPARGSRSKSRRS
ncbi:MAG: UPF0175 family protein [Chloroflexi bacterium]|nr:UPF0175 family protein [Chloroflexota bacterium]